MMAPATKGWNAHADPDSHAGDADGPHRGPGTADRKGHDTTDQTDADQKEGRGHDLQSVINQRGDNSPADPSGDDQSDQNDN